MIAAITRGKGEFGVGNPPRLCLLPPPFCKKCMQGPYLRYNMATNRIVGACYRGVLGNHHMSRLRLSCKAGANAWSIEVSTYCGPR